MTKKISRKDRRILRRQAKNDKQNQSAYQLQWDYYDQLDRIGV